jgi:hypothetical protein
MKIEKPSEKKAVQYLEEIKEGELKILQKMLMRLEPIIT